MLPVAINGHEGNFRHIILTTIMKEAKKEGINLHVPGVISKVKNTLENMGDTLSRNILCVY